jgi:putative endonuclease
MKNIEKPSRRATGYNGEEIARRYLEEKWYTIVEMNYTIRGGEIDIIAEDGEIIVFVEVRYRFDESHAHPLDTFTPMKRRTLLRSVMFYVSKHRIPEERIRIDFIGIMPKKDGTEGHRLWHIRGVEM